MRNFRTAAVASATALTVAFGGIATASAEDAAQDAAKNDSSSVLFAGKQKDTDKETAEWMEDGFNGLSSGQGSSQFFNDNDVKFDATDAFGEETDAAALPQWARVWLDLTAIAGIGSLIGLIIAGFNWASFNGMIQF
ncbi:hypothetical protein [Corynebacterium sp. LK2510]|uniref:hypothetical protein n=1 Tax=Corynebacterium sp. LK2510 TaxID=3110472 RepID=UPI0034CDF62D